MTGRFLRSIYSLILTIYSLVLTIYSLALTIYSLALTIYAFVIFSSLTQIPTSPFPCKSTELVLLLVVKHLNVKPFRSIPCEVAFTMTNHCPMKVDYHLLSHSHLPLLLCLLTHTCTSPLLMTTHCPTKIYSHLLPLLRPLSLPFNPPSVIPFQLPICCTFF